MFPPADSSVLAEGRWSRPVAALCILVEQADVRQGRKESDTRNVLGRSVFPRTLVPLDELPMCTPPLQLPPKNVMSFTVSDCTNL